MKYIDRNIVFERKHTKYTNPQNNVGQCGISLQMLKMIIQSNFLLIIKVYLQYILLKIVFSSLCDRVNHVSSW